MNDTNYEQLAGGTIRVSSGNQPQPLGTAPEANQSRVYGGTIRVTAGQDATETATARHVVSYAGTEGGSVLATLDRAGSRPSVELIPGNPASRTSVEAAILMGVLKRGHGLEEVSHGTQAAPQAPQQGHQQVTQQEAQQAPQQGQQADANEGVFDPAEDAAFAREMDAIPEHVYSSALGAGVRDVVFDGDFKAAAARLVEAGTEPAQAAEHVENARWYFQQMTDRAIAKVGVGDDLREAFYADLRQDMGKLQNAIGYLTRGKDVSHFQAAAREWMARRDLKGSRL